MPKSHVCLATSETVHAALAMLRSNECKVDHDKEAGTAQAWDGDQVVYRAIQKGRGQPWMVRCIDSDRIQWVR